MSVQLFWLTFCRAGSIILYINWIREMSTNIYNASIIILALAERETRLHA